MSGIPNFPFGSDVLIRFDCQDEAGDYQDPTTVSVSVDPPDETPQTFTYPSAALTRLDQGKYQLVYVPDAAGDYAYTVITSDANPALTKEQPGKFAVSAAVTSP